MKWIVRGVLLLVVVGFLAVSALAAILMTFDPNDHKDRLAQAVKATTGRDVEFGGDMNVMFYPVLGFEANQVRIGNPEGFTNKDFIKVGQVQAGLKIFPLLNKRVELATLRLVEPDITVIKTASGKNNLSFKSGAKTGAAEKSDKAAIAFSIDGIDIQKARVTSIDQKTGKTTIIAPFNLSLPGFESGRETSVTTDFTVTPDKDGNAISIKGDGRVRADLDAGTFDVTYLKSDITVTPPGGAEPLKLTVNADIAINNKAQTIAVKNLKADGKGTTLKGQFDVKGYEAPHVNFTLNASSIDLSALSPQKANAGAASGKSTAPKDDTKTLLPLDLLRNISADGQLTIGSLKAANLTMTGIQSRVTAKNGLIDVKPASLNLYDGVIEAALQIDARSANPSMHLNGKVINVQVAGLLKDKMGADYLSGLTNVTFDLKSAGNTMRNLNNNAGGSVDFSFTNGYINKWDLSKRINQAIAYFETGKLTENVSDKIYFTSLKGGFKGEAGVFRNSDLTLLAPKSHAIGSGSVSLSDQSVDYTLRVGLGDKPEDLQKKKHLPIRMNGPFAKPQYSIDTQALIQDVAGEKIEEKKQELMNKAFEKLQGKKATPEASASPSDPATTTPSEPKPDPAKDLLKGLLGGG